MTSPGADPQRDQYAARLRDLHGPDAPVFTVPRREMEALIERGASSDEIRAWLQIQLEQHIADRAAIRALETGETDERTPMMTDQDSTGRAGPDTGTRPTTYNDAQSTYKGTTDARERHDELTNRDLSARSLATLKARGTYDPAKHGTADPAPLTLDERLEVIAAGEVLARYYRHPSQVDHAVKAGASWEQIGEATGISPEQARQEYREWADGQHRLWEHYEGKLGMSDAAYTEAISRTQAAERCRYCHEQIKLIRYTDESDPGVPAVEAQAWVLAATDGTGNDAYCQARDGKTAGSDRSHRPHKNSPAVPPGGDR